MGKMKELSLRPAGYCIRGFASVVFLNGEEGENDIQMFNLPCHLLTADNVKRNIQILESKENEPIKSVSKVTLWIYTVYGSFINPYEKFSRTIELNSRQAEESYFKNKR